MPMPSVPRPADNCGMPLAKRHDDDQTPRGHLDEGRLHDLLGYQMAQATIVTTAAFMRAVGTPLKLRPVEYTILQLINENGAITPGRLARALGMTAPGITVWLDRLHGRGLVLRERSQADRRVQDVSLTAEGQALVSQASGVLLAAEDEALQPLTRGERTMLLELLHKVACLRSR